AYQVYRASAKFLPMLVQIQGHASVKLTTIIGIRTRPRGNHANPDRLVAGRLISPGQLAKPASHAGNECHHSNPIQSLHMASLDRVMLRTGERPARATA